MCPPAEPEEAAPVVKPARAADKPKKARPKRALTHSEPLSPPQAGVEGLTLIPGSHIDPHGVVHYQSGATFADHVLSYVEPHGLLYKRDGVLGTIETHTSHTGSPDARSKTEFRPFDKLAEDRVFFDTYGPRCVLWKPNRDGGADRFLTPYGEDHARIIRAAAVGHPSVPELQLVVHAPAFNRKGEPLQHGYNPWQRTFSTWLPADRSDVTLDPMDLVEDFPFVSASDKAGLMGAIVTMLMRPAIRGNVPVFLLEASAPGSGKTMLVDTVISGLMLGKRASAMQIGNDEAERDKRIISILLSGQSLVLLDNLPQRLDSGSFASAVTAETYSARGLGSNRMLHATNFAVWFLTANNLEITEELARRTMPIRLEPPSGPRRYRFPNLLAEILRNRDAYLRGAAVWIQRWVDAGCPLGETILPSFEDWSQIIGGVMLANGWDDAWMANRRAFMEQADSEVGDFRALMEWWPLVGERHAAKDLVAACETLGIFPAALSRDTDHKRATALGKALHRFKGRVAGSRKLSVEGSSSAKWYRAVQA